MKLFQYLDVSKYECYVCDVEISRWIIENSAQKTSQSVKIYLHQKGENGSFSSTMAVTDSRKKNICFPKKLAKT